jgi:hypothetical protein
MTRISTAWLAVAALALGVPSCRCGSDVGQLRLPGEHPSAAASGTSVAATVRAPSPGLQSWPVLPPDAAALAEQRVRHFRRSAAGAREARSPELGPAPSAEQLLSLLAARQREGGVLAGWPAIVDWFQSRLDAASQAGRPSYLLWGVYHDSAEQVAAFGQLVGPLGLDGPLGVALELFEADGSWAGVDPEAQRGDDLLLARYLAGGDPTMLAELWQRQERVDYTAWKYGFLSTVLDLVVRARASGQQLIGCNMPSALQERGRARLGERIEELRELHCALALRAAFERAPAPARVAMLWGQAHLAPDGFERFLPAEAEVLSVRVLGGRPNDPSLELPLGEKLGLSDPLLFTASESQPGTTLRLVLLLPSGALDIDVDRVRTSRGCPLPDDQQRRLRLSSSEAAELRIDAAAVLEIGPRPRSLVLAPGAHGYWLEGASLALGGAFDMPEAGQVELELHPSSRSVSVSMLDCSARGASPSDEP